MINKPMPPRTPRAIISTNRTYKLEDFIGKDEDYIKNSLTGSILIDSRVLSNNLDLLRKIISIKGNIQINCLDYVSALCVENNIEDDVIIALVDDYQNRDRSYIDTTEFKKHKFFIPLSYCMWDPVISESCHVYCFRHADFDTMVSWNGDKLLYKETIEKAKEIVGQINCSDLSALDKCVLVSNYIQSKVQYVEGIESYADKTYMVDAKPEEVAFDKVSSVDTVLNHNYGLCVSIANVTTLLLNNPTFNINARSVFGSSHAWNIVKLDGENRYIDNTWGITRNKNRVDEALKAEEFSSDYMLFGSVRASQIGHHMPETRVDEVETDDYCQEKIERSRKKLSKTISFSNYGTALPFRSRIKK